MSKIDNLEVDRVDAVGEPATERRWLLVKSEDGDPQAKLEQVTGIVKSAGETLVAFAKAEIELPAELAEQFATLAKSLELGDDVVFKSVAAVEPPAEDAPLFRNAEEASALIVKTLRDELPGVLKVILDEERETVEKQRGEGAPASRQPDEQDALIEKGREREFGKGMFNNIVG